MRSIYLDANIYSYASSAGQVEQVRSWLDSNGWGAVASMVNLIELARTGDRNQGRAFVGALTRIARDSEDPPFTSLLADEFLAEVHRYRPRWIKASGWAGRAHLFAAPRKKWRAVRQSVDEAFVGLPEFSRFHERLERGLHDQQVQIAGVLRDRDVVSLEILVPPTIRRLVGDEVADRVDSLPVKERFVRLAALEDWGAAVFGATPNDLRSWIEGHVHPIEERALAEFWLSEVRLDAVPHHLIRALVRNSQPSRTVVQSNRNDLDQANWALRVEMLLTADKRFCDLLLQAREQVQAWVPGVRVSKIGRVQHDSDLRAELQTAIEAAR